MDDKAKRSKVMSEKLYSWSIKMLVRLEKVEKPLGSARTNYFEIFAHDKSIEAFTQVYNQILNEVQTSKDEVHKRSSIGRKSIEYSMISIGPTSTKRWMPKNSSSATFEWSSRRRSRRLNAPSIPSPMIPSRRTLTRVKVKQDLVGVEVSTKNRAKVFLTYRMIDDSVDEVNELDYMLNMRSELKNNGQVKVFEIF